MICHDSILPNSIENPASYTALPTKDLKRDSTVEDICDFVVEYIHSDVLVRDHRFLDLSHILSNFIGLVIG